MSFKNLPQTNVKSAGSNFALRNEETGRFQGIITDVREATSNENSNLIGIVDIKVENKPGVFQWFINFNPEKAQQSLDFIVGQVKSAIKSAGKEINLDEEKDIEWSINSLEKLMGAKTKVWFRQSKNGQGRLDLHFDPENTSDNSDIF